MSNSEDIDSTYERLDKAFPAPEADEVAISVLEPPEPITSKQLKDEACEAWNEAGKEEEREGRRGGDSALESLRSPIVFSVAIVAVVGAIIAIAKRLRET